MAEKDNNGWGDKAIYDIPLRPLNFYNHNGTCPTPDGIDGFDMNGEIFVYDDTVVAGGHIGNIESVNLERGICMLGLSYEYDKCMANPYKWESWSGFRCRIDDIRHATDKERKKYDISAKLTCDLAALADAEYKDMRAGFLHF